MRRGEDMRVLVAHVVVPRITRFFIEVSDGVATEQREVVRARQLIPENFESNRAVAVAFPPQDIDHLAIHTDRARRSSQAHPLDDIADIAFEQEGIRLMAHHERTEQLARIKDLQLTGFSDFAYIDADVFQRTRDSRCMRARGHDKARMT